MKEDITILTAFLLSNIPEIITQEEFDEVKQAIENLIKGYRELEEDNQKFESGKFLTPAQCVRIGKDYIPKSKVKEKIEELDKKEKEELKGLKGQDRYFVKQMYMYKRNILQELMEDK